MASSSPSSLLALALTSLPLVSGAFDTTNFFDWFNDELAEVENSPLVFEGEVPEYLTGTFIQTGPARFHWGKYSFTHMMDGYSKVNKVAFGKGGSASYTTKFLGSQFFNSSEKNDKITRGIFVGGVTPNPFWGPEVVTGPNDNNYIKMRKLGDQYMILADTIVATQIQDDMVSFSRNVRPGSMAAFTPGVTWDDSSEPLGEMCMLGTMAHAAQDPVTGVMTGAMGCTGPLASYHVVYNISPDQPLVRKVLAKISLPFGRGPSYMHDMGSTPSSIILIAEPLYMSMTSVVAGEPLGMGSLNTNKDNTIFQVIDRKNGTVRTFETPGFINAHVLNSFEESNGDIVIDLQWFGANNKTTLGWFKRWFLENMESEAVREAWPRNKVVRYRLHMDGSVTKERLFANENEQDDLDVPKINEKLTGLPYCIVYMLHMHSYDYGEDMQSLVSGPFAAMGLAKRNICTGERLGWYKPNQYPSELQFVADPHGKAEDDGVLLGIVFNGNTNSSYFHILDAKTMATKATAALPIKAPFLIHASYFP